MKVLAFDTAMGACSAAILHDDQVLASRFQVQVKGHAETVMDMVSQVCTEARLSVPDVDRLGVTIGPGTFTGQRVGLAAARAMVLGTSVRLVGITTLEAVAAAVEPPHPDDLIVSIFDARRGEVYYQAFNARGAALSTPAANTPERAAQSIAALGKRFVLVGTGCALVADILSILGEVRLDDAAPQPNAIEVARLAARASVEAGAPPSPLYLRAPDAKLPTPKAGS